MVSYLPNLVNLNGMQITEQVRKAAMAWRRGKECSDAAFLDLTSDVCLHVRREEVISNARTNWELLRSQTKCLSTKNSDLSLKLKDDYVLTCYKKTSESRCRTGGSFKVPILSEKKLVLTRTSSQDSQNTSSSNTSSNEFFRLPPILVPIINKLERKDSFLSFKDEMKMSDSVSSIGPNVDSSMSSLLSSETEDYSSTDGEDTDNFPMEKIEQQQKHDSLNLPLDEE